MTSFPTKPLKINHFQKNKNRMRARDIRASGTA